MRDGQYAQALSILQVLVSRGQAGSFEWIDIARCHERLGRPKQALDAYDKAIGDGGWWPPYESKALLLERSEGSGAGAAWLERQLKAAKDAYGKRKYAKILGDLHSALGQYARAITRYEQAVATACAEHEFRFGSDNMLILDRRTLAWKNNDYAKLWPTLEELARCHLALDHVDDAFRCATMGVSIGQQLKRCKGYYDERVVKAGDSGCRLLRAQILMDRGVHAAAETELVHARVLVERSSYGPGLRAVERAEKRLASLRAR